MSCSLLTRRRFCGALIALCPAGQLAIALGDPPSEAAPWRAIRRPCSLRKISKALTRQCHVTVAPDSALADLRVVWAFRQTRPLETLLARLAELTGSRVVERKSGSGTRRLLLEQKPEAERGEAAWRTESLTRTIQELLRAVDENEHGQLQPDSFSKNVQTYLAMGRAPQLSYLQLLTPSEMSRLLQGELVRFAPGAVTQAEIEEIVNERYPASQDADETPERVQQYRDHELQQIHQYGLGLQIDFNRKGQLFYLILKVGDRGANALAGFGSEELGLPATRSNPYRLLETMAQSAPPAEIPPALRRPLETDVSLPAGDTRWETALSLLAQAAGLDVVSDAYLCRAASRQFARRGETLFVARRGVRVGEALDLLCRQYGYLWWEKDGCCYFRARSWPWDQEYEVPDRFLDRWHAALASGPVGAPALAALASLPSVQLNGLGSISGSPFLSRDNLDNEDVRQFLHLFRFCTPAQQARLVGPGLLVPPEQAPGFGPLAAPQPAEAAAPPVLLRLTQAVAVDSSVTPPVTKVTLRVIRPLEPGRRPLEFSVEMPRAAGELEAGP